ncbi:phosphotransferase [Pseudonocardia sp. NPDC049154]|uniref:phosphotransferase family protein n=1 Tax=Pseudonocardia sp. NPDC049154 TaxID=3155501 RepID=UPI0033C10F1D
MTVNKVMGHYKLAGRLTELTGPWLDRFGRHLDDGHVRIVSELARHTDRWLPLLDDHRTLWHGDFRLDNMLFQSHGGRQQLAVLDWQSLKSGPGVIDVSYFLGTSVEPSDRAEHERALVTEYHERVASYEAAEGYSRDDCWLEYRAHAVYGLVLAIAVSMGVQQTPRGDVMFGTMAARAAAQVADLQTYSALATLTRS